MSDVHLISEENYYRLIEHVISDAQPRIHMSCDWFGHIPKPLMYPLAVYRTIEEFKNADSSRNQQ
jgi:hypothetical protein